MMNHKLFKIIFRSHGDSDIGILILRITTGFLMFFNHGLRKITAGNERWERLGHALTDIIGIDAFHVFFGFMASLAESLGGILIAFGLFTRISSFLLFFTMVVASLKHIMEGDFSELALVYALLCIVIIIIGPGKYSADRHLFNKFD